MTACSRGDVVLVGLVFSDESGKKVRPALVVRSPAYQRWRQEVVVPSLLYLPDRERYAQNNSGAGCEYALFT